MFSPGFPLKRQCYLKYSLLVKYLRGVLKFLNLKIDYIPLILQNYFSLYVKIEVLLNCWWVPFHPKSIDFLHILKSSTWILLGSRFWAWIKTGSGSVVSLKYSLFIDI